MEATRKHYVSKVALRQLPKGVKYRDILPCVKYYNAYNCGYNSRERMALRLFNKITRAFIELLLRDMILFGKTVTISAGKILGMTILGRKESYMTKEEYAETCVIYGYLRDVFRKEIKSVRVMPTNAVKERIKEAVNNGVIYKRKFSDARKFKVF